MAKQDSPLKEDAREARNAGLDTLKGWQKALLLCAVLAAALCILAPDIIFENKIFLVPDALAPMNFAVVGEKELERGTYPLWNPYIFCGMPSFASLSFTPYVYPPSFVSYILQHFLGFPEMTWLLMHYFLAGIGMYLLSRSLGCRVAVSIVAGLVFMVLPNYLAMGANGHGSQASSVAYMPFAVLLVRKLTRGKERFATAGFLSIVLGFQILRGHIQIAYYTYLLLAVLFVFEGWAMFRSGERKELVKSAVFLAASFVWALGIAAILILPVREYAAYSIRGASAAGGLDYGYATGWSLHPKEMLTFVFPWAFGYGKSTYWGSMPFTDYPNYLGIVTAIFALYCAKFSRGRTKWFLVVVAVASTLVAFGRFFPLLYKPMFHFLPYFNKFRVPVMALIVQQLAAVLLMALGIEEYLARTSKSKTDRIAARRIGWILIALSVVLFLAIIARGSISRAILGNAVARSRIAGNWISVAAGSYAKDLARTLAVAASAFLVMYLLASKRIGANLAVVALAFIAAVDLFTVDRGVLHPESLWPGAQPIARERQLREAYLEPDEAIRFLKSDTTYFRIFPVPEARIGQWSHNVHPFSENRFMAHGIFSLGGYHAAKLVIYQDVMDAMFSEFNKGHYPAAILDMLSAKYFYSTYPLFKEGTGLPLVMSGGGVFVYENPDAIQRISFHDSVLVLPPKRALEALALGEVDPHRAVILSEKPRIEPLSAEGSHGRIVSYGANEISIRAHVEKPCIMLVSEIWYPDWRAKVDGNYEQIMAADYCLRAIALDEGDHDIVMHFSSTRIEKGLAISIVCFAAAVSAPIISKSKSRWRS